MNAEIPIVYSDLCSIIIPLLASQVLYCIVLYCILLMHFANRFKRNLRNRWECAEWTTNFENVIILIDCFWIKQKSEIKSNTCYRFMLIKWKTPLVEGRRETIWTTSSWCTSRAFGTQVQNSNGAIPMGCWEVLRVIGKRKKKIWARSSMSLT